MSSIEYVNHKDIVNQQWDQCIKSSFNGTVEAFSWYLNLLCDQWDALIEGDYKAVMPLPVRKKFGHPVIYMPPFVNQLGIYSPEQITMQKSAAFLANLKKRFRTINYNINKYTPLPKGIFPLQREVYYELDLIRPYLKTVRDYSHTCRNRLHDAADRKYSVIRGVALNDLISLVKKNKIMFNAAILSDDCKLLRMLISSVLRYKTGELYGAYNQVNMLGCVVLFLWSDNSVIMLFTAATEEAIAENAHLLIYDRFIEKYSETNVTLSFQFRDAYHSAEIYAGFGATESIYRRIHYSRLPFFLKPFLD
ncbi:MAG: hypothetical protein JXR41_11805 [Bacteroidales bacterium]|nr:hypothetical protein [Bacteroidales bacterium]MBN2763768.1 hypothetical protein [Bacteroidales bacterium]